MYLFLDTILEGGRLFTAAVDVATDFSNLKMCVQTNRRNWNHNSEDAFLHG